AEDQVPGNNPIADTESRVLTEALIAPRRVAELDNQHVVQFDAGQKRAENRLLDFAMVAQQPGDITVVLAGTPQNEGKAYGVETRRGSIGPKPVGSSLMKLVQ